MTDPVGRVTTYAYDALSRQIAVANPAIQAAPLLATAYTPDGLIGSLTDANGNAIGYAYDGLDRLSVATYPATAAIGVTTESYTYDANSNVKTRVTRRGDTISFGYDTLNRLITKTEPAGTPSVSYGYDLVGRLISVSDNGAALIAATPATSFAETTSYDALNRPISMSWNPAAAQTTPTAASVAFSFGYDGSNRRVSQSANDNTWISYPGPTSATAYTSNALNQYAAVAAVAPTYDANGNLTFDGSFTYAYDAENRLTAITQGGTTIASYTYDGRGRRKSRTVGGTTTVDVTGAEDQDLLEYNGTSGAPNAVYAVNLGGGLDDVLNRVAPGGPRQTLVPDIQSSIVASLDSGGSLSRIAYQAFGESPSAVAAGAGPRYTARRLDPETAIAGGAQPNGLYYYRARMYSPTWGRFLQPDPIGPTGGGNLYAYVGNDPVNNTDPLGLWQVTLSGGFGFGGALTFGYNSGQWTVGAFVGPAVGANLAINPANSAAVRSGTYTSFVGSAGAELGPLGAEIGASAQTTVPQGRISTYGTASAEASLNIGPYGTGGTATINPNGSVTVAPKVTVGLGTSAYGGWGISYQFTPAQSAPGSQTISSTGAESGGSKASK